MSLTIIGFALIGLTGLLIFYNWRSLLLLAIFFSSFSATAIINIEAVTLGLTPYIWFSVIYCLLGLLTRAYVRIVPDSPFRSTVIAGIGVFAVSTLLSTLLASVEGRARLSSVTQSAYLLLGLSMTAITAFVLEDNASRRAAFAFLRYGGIAASVWGLVQLLCSYTGIEYPSWAFNNSVSDFADMFDQKLSVGVQRIASVAVEPSFLAFSLMHVFAFSSTRLLLGAALARRRELVTVTLTGACLLLSTSTTAYVGLATCSILLLYSQPSRTALACIVVTLAVSALFIFYEGFADSIRDVTVAKLDSWSFKDRFANTERGLNLFLSRPLIGNGWGSAQDMLPIQLLATVGLVGTLCFLLSIGWTLLGASRALGAGAPSDPELWLDGAGCKNALICSLTMSVASGFKFVVFDFWLMWGATIAATAALFQINLRKLIRDRQWPAAGASHIVPISNGLMSPPANVTLQRDG